jgi:hypothetical protein
MGKYSVSSDVAGAPQKRSLGDATSYKSTAGKDQMDGVGMDSPPSPALKMSEGNILEAHGRDVSNKSIDADGWGGEDAPYRGMADDAPYGAGSGMKGSSASRGRR